MTSESKPSNKTQSKPSSTRNETMNMIKIASIAGVSLLLGAGATALLMPGMADGKSSPATAEAYMEKALSQSVVADEDAVAKVGTRKVHGYEVQLYAADKNLSRAEAVDQWINIVALAQAAETSGVESTDQVEAEMRFMRSQLLANQWLVNKREEVQPTDEEIQARYDEIVADKDRFREYHVEAVTGERDEMLEVLTKLQSGKVSERESIEWSPVTVGTGDDDQNNWVRMDQMPPLFAAIVGRLADGDSTPTPVAVGGNTYMVLRRVESREGTPPELEEVSDQLRTAMVSARVASAIADVRSKLDITIR